MGNNTPFSRREALRFASLASLSAVCSSQPMAQSSTPEGGSMIGGMPGDALKKTMPPGPIRALAPDHVLFDETSGMPAPLGTPTILRLDGGRLVAASDRGGVSMQEQGNPRVRICTSDDGGLTWTTRATPYINQARLFQCGTTIYYLGYNKDLKIMKSEDRGEHWSELFDLATKKSQWYAQPCNVWHAKGNVYLVMERRVYEDNQSGWTIGNLAPILMRAREQDDLTLPSSWSYASWKGA